MNIDAAFREMTIALADEDYDRLEDLVDGASAWLSRGGFAPRGLRKDQARAILMDMSDEISRALSDD